MSNFPQIDPTPWQIGGPKDFDTCLVPIERKYGHTRVAFATTGNAEFIVLMCNAYDDMLEALEDAQLALSICEKLPNGDLRRVCQNALFRVRQAIAKAKGETK